MTARFSKFLLIFILATGWIFSGWPQIWHNPQFPPEIQKAHAAIGIGTPSTNSCDCNQLTISGHNISGTDPFIVVEVSLDDGSSDKNVSSVTYNGVNLTNLSAVNGGGVKIAAEVWYLAPASNPANGNYDVVITISGGNTQKITAGVITLTGVDQTTPVDTGTVKTQDGKNTTPLLSVTSETDDLVMDVLSSQDGDGLVPGNGQAEQWDLEIGGTGVSGHFGGASTEVGATSVTMDWTTTNDFMSHIAFNINQAGTASLTFVVSTDNFPALIPGDPVFATTTLSVDTDNSTGWNITVSRDDSDTTMDLDSDAAVNINDQTPWVPGTATTTAGNAVRISSLDSSGDILAMRVMTASGTQAFIATDWWGTTDDYADNVDTLWAGMSSTSQKIGDSSVSCSGADCALNTVLYYLDVPTTQKTGAYSGGVTFTAVMN